MMAKAGLDPETMLLQFHSVRFCEKNRNYMADFADLGESLISDCVLYVTCRTIF